MVPEAGLEPVLPCGKGILRRNDKGGESRTSESCLDSSPFPVYEEYDECSTVRGSWSPRWTPVLLNRRQRVTRRPSVHPGAVIGDLRRRSAPRLLPAFDGRRDGRSRWPSSFIAVAAPCAKALAQLHRRHRPSALGICQPRGDRFQEPLSFLNAVVLCAPRVRGVDQGRTIQEVVGTKIVWADPAFLRNGCSRWGQYRLVFRHEDSTMEFFSLESSTITE